MKILSIHDSSPCRLVQSEKYLGSKDATPTGTTLTQKREEGEMTTYNNGVWLEGFYSSSRQVDYYGVLEEVWELSYTGLDENIVLFKCSWFDSHEGIKVHPKNDIMELKSNKRGSHDDPFILASQAKQVLYLNYAGKKKSDWIVATKTYARNRIDWTHVDNSNDDNDVEFFQEEVQAAPIVVHPTNELDDDEILVVPGLYDRVEIEDANDDDN